MSEYEVMTCAHNALLAHGRAVRTIREFAKTAPVIGFAPVGDVKVPAVNSEENISAAYEEMFKPLTPHYWGNAIWIDPVMTGEYHPEIREYFEKSNIKITDEDMKTIGEPIDFLGMNIYTASRVREDGTPLAPKVGFDQTAIGWEVVPEALYWGPRFYWERYKKPIFITENGMANVDFVSADGKVHDPQRIEFLRRYLSCLRTACLEGVDVRGYFQWSLMDNFEWAEGYQKRFGLIYVDYETQQRIPKDSFEWYKQVIARNGGEL
jgi:beta-glucosidase